MDYRYIYHPNGIILLESNSTHVRVKLNIITRFLFGEGACANQVFNCGTGAFIKFQSTAETNKQRAFLTTRIYRYCIKNNIEINQKTFPSIKEQRCTIMNFNDFIIYLNERKER